ncbi:MAG: hypothetical protein KBD06_03420, partial [Candidatus Pacebacteria bacterium]|nr:hypothetical protein [Candidatus Paceibacterota bacterium]
PKWFKGVISGDKSDGASDSKDTPAERPKLVSDARDGAPEPQPEEETIEAIRARLDEQREVMSEFDKMAGKLATEDDAIRPEALVFEMQKGWKQVGGDVGDGSEIAPESALVRLYLSLSGKPPADFERSSRPDRVKEAAENVISWSVQSLHSYLSRPDVWKRPSFTKAVFEEIRERMLIGSMAPRK